MRTVRALCKERRRATEPADFRVRGHAGHELSLHRKIQTHHVIRVRKKLKVLALFDWTEPTTLDHDLSARLQTEDCKTYRHVLEALRELGHTTETLALYDNLDLVRQKLQSFQPDIIFNL